MCPDYPFIPIPKYLYRRLMLYFVLGSTCILDQQSFESPVEGTPGRCITAGVCLNPTHHHCLYVVIFEDLLKISVDECIKGILRYNYMSFRQNGNVGN